MLEARRALDVGNLARSCLSRAVMEAREVEVAAPPLHMSLLANPVCAVNQDRCPWLVGVPALLQDARGGAAFGEGPRAFPARRSHA
eukprot:4936498-Pyramimonas_sp.AAC.1